MQMRSVTGGHVLGLMQHRGIPEQRRILERRFGLRLWCRDGASSGLRALSAVAAVGALSACAAPSSYMGIDIRNPAPEITVNAEQQSWLAQRQQLRELVSASGCVAAERDGAPPPQGNAKLCSDLEAQAIALELAKPEFAFTRDYKAMALSTLASRAQSGDKNAQLELGIRFEEGRGVAADQAKARKLYAKAAADSGGTIWVYSPPVGNGTSGRVIPVDTGPKQSGLTEAKRRLRVAE